MKSVFRFATIAILAAAVALCAPGPGASSEHYVVANDNDFVGENYGTIMRLEGSAKNPLLGRVTTLQTNVSMPFGDGAYPNVQIIRSGADICVFIADTPGPGNDISAFKYPGLGLVGNYSDPEIQYESFLSIAAHGKYMFAAYNGDSFYLDTWQIDEGCTLSLAHTMTLPTVGIISMAVTPNGKTLLVNHGSANAEVGSLSIASDGSLTPHGPYLADGRSGQGGVDVTADSKYALFNIESFPSPPDDDDYTQVDVFPINSDGSLGTVQVFGGDGQLGLGYDSGPIWLSANEKFLFSTATASGSLQVTSLYFSENPVNLTYSCIVSPRDIQQPASIGGLATALPSGSGGYLYVTETASHTASAAIGTFSINPSGGCLTEAPQSPFSIN